MPRLLGVARRCARLEHGWLKVLKTSGNHLKEVMKRDLGVEVEIYQPKG